MMKNASIKEMIRKQKLDATDRRDMVSNSFGVDDLDWICFVFRKFEKRNCSSEIGLLTASWRRIISVWKLKRKSLILKKRNMN